ncbi:phosphate system positive regulatory protein pho81 [Apophysomyces ossiformis]|uniref:Phosphate system positive regulatory protein pho81 n=1 Tax=Apophysomyces ossiformis TaxID=679940 RepID=A0A8H7EML3_9FUNG|nr:phosphate system positive regulatory protein pho81 [Apophysomyces ossiformis]
MFGKQIQSQQFTEWSAHYLDYKGLKKFISSLLNQPRSNSVSVSNGTPLEDDPSKLLQSQKAAFFFKLERELEKINSFYLRKENELKVRLRTLVDKKKYLLQKYVELNNEGFRKILKKWDKRSKSTTKELYLSRQIDIQPCFNTQILSELADLASINRVELSNIQDGIPVAPVTTTTTHDSTSTGDPVVDDMELELVKAVSSGQVAFVREILVRNAHHPSPDDRERLSRVFWHACSEATTEIMNLLIDTNAVNFEYVDDINERSCLHMAAMAGRRELLESCTAHGANVRAIDAYGRTALHYATMKGFSDCVSFLLTHNVDIESRDHDGFSPLIYAIMNGHTSIVDILINAGANIEPQHNADHIPLSLACYYGHTDIAVMLYERGAKNLPNAESLYPLHLAARQGHVELCRLLSKQSEQVDRPDKYNSWTPLFWAASDGHAECVRILIEAGCQVNVKDENGKTALYYAAWEGQKECMDLLIDAGCEVEPVQDESSYSELPSAAKEDNTASSTMSLELDTIPSLSLPPPIIPFRIYGHNYLDRKYQVHISLCQPPIRLYDNTQISSLKLVISSKPDTGMIPHSVILPLADDREMFNFQVHKLDDFLLEFDIFATFGSKVLGRGAALPQMFSSTDFKITDGHRTIPLVDGHLKVIGELSFDYAVVKPFRGVQLEIGGRIETYWKSTNTLPPVSSTHLTPEPASSSSTIPSFITASSLSGDYVRVVVQLTKDLVPVVFANWLVPFDGLDLAVSDLTYEQFCRMGEKVLENKSVEDGIHDKDGICPFTGNSILVQQIGKCKAFLSLQTVLQKIPSNMGVHLELKYPYVNELAIHTFANIADRNTFVDTILQCIYDHVRSLPSDAQNTSIFFSSFNPAICTVVNWKQPNYAVFFNTYCGLNMGNSRRGTKRKSIGSEETNAEVKHTTDLRCASLKEAVKFAKRNNLLGVISEATPLVQVPSLIQNIKESGLILVTFGAVNSDVRYRRIQERYGVDAMIINEVVHFNTTMAGAGF